jgi:hypothetical protein
LGLLEIQQKLKDLFRFALLREQTGVSLVDKARPNIDSADEGESGQSYSSCGDGVEDV